jgi:hypothetical protein
MKITMFDTLHNRKIASLKLIPILNCYKINRSRYHYTKDNKETVTFFIMF